MLLPRVMTLERYVFQGLWLSTFYAERFFIIILVSHGGFNYFNDCKKKIFTFVLINLQLIWKRAWHWMEFRVND